MEKKMIKQSLIALFLTTANILATDQLQENTNPQTTLAAAAETKPQAPQPTRRVFILVRPHNCEDPLCPDKGKPEIPAALQHLKIVPANLADIAVVSAALRNSADTSPALKPATE